MNEDFSEAFIEARRRDLERMRAEILGRSREALQSIRAQEHEVGDSVDTSTEEQGTSTMLRLKDRDKEELYAIEEALDRLEEGDYGDCEECGDLIGARRLEVRPAAALCIECQEELEEQQRRRRARPGLIDEYM